MNKDTAKKEERQEEWRYAAEIERKLYEDMREVFAIMDRLLDRRLVVTLFRLMLALMLHRHRNEGNWLSELGSYLVPENAEAGRKRIEKLLYSRKWSSEHLEEIQWRRGDHRVEQGEIDGETILSIWDESVLKKPESLKLEGLGSVRSSKAVCLKRIKPGFFNPPGGRPIMVPGFHWLQVLVCGMKGPIIPVHQCLWTNRGDQASTKREEERQVL